MASSKKTSPSKSKSSKSEQTNSKIEDAVIVEEVQPSVPVDDAPKAAAEAAVTTDETNTETDTPTEEIPAGPDEAPAEVGEASTTAELVHPVPAVAPEPQKSSGFLPLVLGGIIAGAIGFFAAQTDVFEKPAEDPTVQLRSDLTAQQERIAALENVEPAEVPTPDIDLSGLENRLSDLEGRIAALEERPAASVPEGVDAQAYAAELEGLKASVETQRSEIEALLKNAKTVEEATAEAATIASAQAAVAQIVSAIDAGRPFADQVSQLQALDLGEIDPALVSVASDGVATLSALQAEFPDQARMALSVARASGVDEGQQGLGSFLKRSLGARSVAPREGNDPDAVLSRAEAAINSGDLAAALSELVTLPEEAQSAIADWRTAADARVAARSAADALSQRLTAD